MRREQLLKEIATLDDEITRIIASAELPNLNARPFPLGTWVFAGLCFAWTEFGYRIPGALTYHLQTARYAWYLGIVMVVVAILSTISWMFRGRGQHHKAEAYYTAARQAKELQQQRSDLQAELRAISGE